MTWWLVLAKTVAAGAKRNIVDIAPTHVLEPGDEAPAPAPVPPAAEEKPEEGGDNGKPKKPRRRKALFDDSDDDFFGRGADPITEEVRKEMEEYQKAGRGRGGGRGGGGGRRGGGGAGGGRGVGGAGKRRRSTGNTGDDAGLIKIRRLILTKSNDVDNAKLKLSELCTDLGFGKCASAKLVQVTDITDANVVHMLPDKLCASYNKLMAVAASDFKEKLKHGLESDGFPECSLVFLHKLDDVVETFHCAASFFQALHDLVTMHDFAFLLPVQREFVLCGHALDKLDLALALPYAASVRLFREQIRVIIMRLYEERSARVNHSSDVRHVITLSYDPHSNQDEWERHMPEAWQDREHACVITRAIVGTNRDSHIDFVRELTYSIVTWCAHKLDDLDFVSHIAGAITDLKVLEDVAPAVVDPAESCTQLETPTPVTRSASLATEPADGAAPACEQPSPPPTEAADDSDAAFAAAQAAPLTLSDLMEPLLMTPQQPLQPAEPAKASPALVPVTQMVGIVPQDDHDAMVTLRSLCTLELTSDTSVEDVRTLRRAAKGSSRILRQFSTSQLGAGLLTHVDGWISRTSKFRKALEEIQKVRESTCSNEDYENFVKAPGMTTLDNFVTAMTGARSKVLEELATFASDEATLNENELVLAPITEFFSDAVRNVSNIHVKTYRAEVLGLMTGVMAYVRSDGFNTTSADDLQQRLDAYIAQINHGGMVTLEASGIISIGATSSVVG